MSGRNRTIGLARVRGMGLLPDLLEARAGDRGLIKVFGSARLPIQALENPDLPIPLTAMADVFASAGELLGQRALGLEVGRGTTHQGWGRWTRYAGEAPTLKAGLSRLNGTAWAHMSNFEMTLRPKGRAWVWRVVPPLGADRVMHYADHLIYPMLSFARLYLGHDWLPEWIEVNYPRDPDIQVIETLLQTPLRCGGRGLAFAFSEEDLAREHPDRRLAATQAMTLRDIVSDVVMADAQEPARSFSAVVAVRLLEGKSDIEGAAVMAGLGVRGLQRRLSTAGYTYKEILEYARRARALELLRETKVSVAEIAFSLGYEEHANFSRAFQRWMGCSPSAYRAKLGIDREVIPVPG